MYMLTPDISNLLDDICSRSADFEIEATLLMTHEVYLRFAMGRIHQNINENQIQLSVRVLKEGRIGMASTNQIDSDAINDVVEKAKSQASLFTFGDDSVGFTTKEELCDVISSTSDIPDLNLTTMTKHVDQAITLAKRSNLETAGLIATIQGKLGFATSQAGKAITDFSRSWMNMMFINEKQKTSSWASLTTKIPEDIDSTALSQEAYEKVIIPKEDKKVLAGNYPVILDTYCVAEILSILTTNCFVGPEFHKEGLISIQKLGEQIADKSISIWDDGHDPEGCPVDFDFDGISKQRVMLIEEGKVAGAVYDRSYAKKFGIKSTGNAQSRLRSFNSGPQAENLFLNAGIMGLDDMIKTIKHGLFITRFQYTTLSDPSNLIIKGTTRDGSYWIENGKIQCALPNLAFKVSIIKILENVIGLSRDTRLLECGFGVVRTPSLLIKEFTII